LKEFCLKVLALSLLVCCVCYCTGVADLGYASEKYPTAVKIVAPDGLSTKIRSEPSETAEVVGIALNGDILEVTGGRDSYVSVFIPGTRNQGYVLTAHTIPWTMPAESGFSIFAIGAIGAIVLLAAGLVTFLFWSRARRDKDAVQHAASIPTSIKRAEDIFRSGDYDMAVREFNSYLALQGGEVRNPDVYRRIAVCYQNLRDPRSAAAAWEKMRSLGGLRTVDDYTLGVEIMSARGKDSEAAAILEQLLESESDEDKAHEIRTRLFDLYRRTKQGPELVRHAVELVGSSLGDRATILADTVSFLMAENQTDLAIEFNNKEIIKTIAKEFLDDNSRKPAAARIYLKCLDYDRTDPKLHRALAEIYSDGGDVRRAVSEFTILQQLDRDQADYYVDQAARIYVENSMVHDALAEGNPQIIKKIAQLFLARSEVNPDAVAVYEKVLELQPRAVGINKMLSTVYLTRGELDKYMARLRLLHEIDGANQDYLTDLAQCVIDNDLVDEIIREGNRDLNAKILKQLIKRGVYTDKAVSLFEKLIKHEPGNVLIQGALAKAYERREEYPQLLDVLISLGELKPEDEEYIEKASNIAVRHGLLDKITARGSIRLLELTALTMIEQRKADMPGGRELLEKAHRSVPGNTVIDETLAFLKSAAPNLSEQPLETVPEYTAELASEPSVRPSGVIAEAEASESTVVEPDLWPAKTEAPAAPMDKDEQPLEQEEKAQPEPALPPVCPEPFQTREQAAEDISGRATPPLSEPPKPQDQYDQFVQLNDPNVPFEEKAVTTFVSGHAQGVTYYRPEELFLPYTGGLAYKDLAILAEDGWGTFRMAIEVNTGRSVLLRVFHKDLLEYSWMKDFVSEITDLAHNLIHESILPVEETVTSPAGLTGLVHPHFTFTLEGALKSGKRPDLKQASALIDSILDGLTYAHQYKGPDGKLRRTFHLHLQPSQILAAHDLMHCKIASLGYSQTFRNLTRATRSWWQEPSMNPATMPPEFFRAKGTGVREKAAEVYSLGVLMYCIVTGEYPFEGPAFDDYKFQHTKVFPAPPRLINPTVPDWVEVIIQGCLEKDPDARWDSIAEIREAFRKGSQNPR